MRLVQLTVLVQDANSMGQISFSKNFKQQGFSLIEMAVVMVIVGTLLGGLLVSLSSTREINFRNDATDQIDEIMEALYGFAQANGRLPCPATVASAGAEDPLGGGNCTQDYGFIPSATLGISGAVDANGLMVDPWLSPYRYNVSDVLANAFTTAGGIRAAGFPALAATPPDLRVCTDAACGTVIANSLPVVVVSLGANWASFSGADEVENSGEATVAGFRHANNTDFASSTYIEDVFDDTLSWMSSNILYTRMISAGQLP